MSTLMVCGDHVLTMHIASLNGIYGNPEVRALSFDGEDQIIITGRDVAHNKSRVILTLQPCGTITREQFSYHPQSARRIMTIKIEDPESVCDPFISKMQQSLNLAKPLFS